MAMFMGFGDNINQRKYSTHFTEFYKNNLETNIKYV